MPHGQGEIHFANGNTYRGQWVDGLGTSEGVLTYGDGHAENAGDSYEGAFLNDLRHGKGRYIWADGKVDKVSCE